MDPNLRKLLIVYMLFVNILTFILYGVDKYKARHHRFRIPEITLLLCAYFGGAYGAAAGMKIWHHKTRKWKFRIAVPMAVLFVTALLLIPWLYHMADCSI